MNNRRASCGEGDYWAIVVPLLLVVSTSCSTSDMNPSDAADSVDAYAASTDSKTSRGVQIELGVAAADIELADRGIGHEAGRPQPDAGRRDATADSGLPGEAGGTALYDLSGFDVPFAFNWPTRPTTGQTVVVTNNEQLAAALAMPHTRIEISAGTYGELVLTEDDQHILASNVATFSGLRTAGRPARVILEGGVIEAGSTNSISLVLDDFVMKNVHIASVSTFALGLGSNKAHRVALIHNTIYAARVGLYSPGVVGGVTRSTDFFIAANYLQGGMTPSNSGVEPALRIQGHLRAVIVDNRARCGFDGQGTKHTYRSHYGNHNYFMRRNMNEYGDGIYFKPRANREPVVADNFMGDHWVYDHVSYYNGPMGANSANAFRDDVSTTYWYGNLVAQNNVAYRAVQANPTGEERRWYWNPQRGDSVLNNRELPYQPPPPLNAWLASDGLPPGADH